MVNFINKKALLIIAAVLFLSILTIHEMLSVHSPVAQFSTKIFHKSKQIQLRDCINYVSELEITSENFVEFYRQCVKALTPQIEFDTFYMGRFFEYKMFLPLKPSFKQKECKWLTIGIGGTSFAEKNFKEKYPECSIYGIEPSLDQYENFTEYGTVIPYGVGATKGSFNLTLREGTVYVEKIIQVLALSEILDKFVGTRFVQYMTIDIEFFEYNILEEFLHGGIIYNEGIVFCQIDAELHGLNKTRTMKVLNAFNSDRSDYFPVFTRQFWQHEKVTWVNKVDKRCQNAFDLKPFIEL